jgi:hypothetical protein
MAEAATAAVADLSLEYNPSTRNDFYKKRIELFEKFHARQDAQVEEARKAAVPIKVVLPDGAVKPAIKGATTPLDIAGEISKSLAKKVLVAKVDGELWDAFRPLEGDCALQLLSWDDVDGKEVRLGRSVRSPGPARRSDARSRLPPERPRARCSGACGRSGAWGLPRAPGGAASSWAAGSGFPHATVVAACAIRAPVARAAAATPPHAPLPPALGPKDLLAQQRPRAGRGAGDGVRGGPDDRPRAGGGLLLRLLHGR